MLCCCRGYSLGSLGRAEAALRQPPDENLAKPDAQQIAPKRGLHEVASTENPASRLLLGVKAGSYRRRERLLQYVLAVRGTVSEQTVDGVTQGRKTVSADLEGDE